jgi:Uma2 family endonuclease
LALLRPGFAPQWNDTAALVVEIVSPSDKTWEKLGFYAAHRVDELLIVDPQERKAHWLGLQADGQYRPMERSGLIELGPAELAGRIDWPV